MATGICPWCGKKADKFIMFRGDIVGCRYCGIHTKQTNADRIRSMTDEELARFLDNHGSLWGHDIVSTANDWLDWLRKEVSDGIH